MTLPLSNRWVNWKRKSKIPSLLLTRKPLCTRILKIHGTEFESVVLYVFVCDFVSLYLSPFMVVVVGEGGRGWGGLGLEALFAIVHCMFKL